LYERICSFENLLKAYERFRQGKRFKKEVLEFDYYCERGLLQLQDELLSLEWMPLPPKVFYVFEPKKRLIVAANLRDRIVHSAYCNVIEPIFDKRLIYDTYACRIDKGTLGAVRRFDRFMKDLLRNHNEKEVTKYFESKMSSYGFKPS